MSGRHNNEPVGPGGWADRAACARLKVSMAISNNAKQGPGSPASESRKTICRACPVLEPCREWAMSEPDPAFMHIAGGLHPIERARMRRAGGAGIG